MASLSLEKSTITGFNLICFRFVLRYYTRTEMFSTDKPNRLTREPLLMGELSTVDLLVKIACFIKRKNIFFRIKNSWSELVSTRRSTVLRLPLQKGFLVLMYSILMTVIQSFIVRAPGTLQCILTLSFMLIHSTLTN